MSDAGLVTVQLSRFRAAAIAVALVQSANLDEAIKDKILKNASNVRDLLVTWTKTETELTGENGITPQALHILDQKKEEVVAFLRAPSPADMAGSLILENIAARGARRLLENYIFPSDRGAIYSKDIDVILQSSTVQEQLNSWISAKEALRVRGVDGETLTAIAKQPELLEAIGIFSQLNPG